MPTTFTQSQLEAVASALGDTEDGLTGGEIGHLLQVAAMPDPAPSLKKGQRLFNAFVASQNERQNRGAILKFIRQAMKPERYLQAPHRFEPLRMKLNRALAFAGLAVDAQGVLGVADVATTIPEAERRARELREDLLGRGVHAVADRAAGRRLATG